MNIYHLLVSRNMNVTPATVRTEPRPTRRYTAVFMLAGILISILSVMSQAQENPCSFSGYLWGTGARSSFEVYSDTEELQIVFTWPSGTSDIWVKATGSDGTEVLVERSLNEGDLFTLTGRGIFHFEIYSKWGGGCWSASIKK